MKKVIVAFLGLLTVCLTMSIAAFAADNTDDHYFINGVCYECGYVKEGVVKRDDQNWYYVVDDQIQTDYTGLQKNRWGTWRIVNGKVDFKARGIFSDESGDWYVSGGKVQSDCNDILYLDNNGDAGWWLIKNGQVSYENTLAENKWGWWYCENGKINFDAYGIYSNSSGDWYVSGGKVQSDCNDILYLNNKGDIGWWLIKNGKVSYENTLAQNQWGWWYCKNGKVDFSANGIYSNSSGDWYVSGGEVQFGCHDILYLNNNGDVGWWLIKDGKVSYETTLDSNKNGWWYCKNGKVDFSYNGIFSNKWGDWYVLNGELRFDITDVLYLNNNGTTAWWYIKSGRVSYETTLAKNKNGWWYVENGCVNFKKYGNVNGTVNGVTGKWYVAEGMVVARVYSDALTEFANKYTSSTKWLILVNCTSNYVAIYYGDNYYRTLYAKWSCATGAAGTETPKGIYYVNDSRGYSFSGTYDGNYSYWDSNSYTCYYYTGFIGGMYLFHSTIYRYGSLDPLDSRLGMNLSHGCVRLAIENAKWIQNNIPTGTTVVIY